VYQECHATRDQECHATRVSGMSCSLHTRQFVARSPVSTNAYWVVVGDPSLVMNIHDDGDDNLEIIR
jgi:hypothetical protein